MHVWMEDLSVDVVWSRLSCKQTKHKCPMLVVQQTKHKCPMLVEQLKFKTTVNNKNVKSRIV